MNALKWMVIGATLFVSACATEKTLVPTGGSRSDGTVTLSYEYGMFEVPHVDLARGTTAATARCKAWGYSGAEPFGGQTTKCQVVNGYGNCLQTLVMVTYQCTSGTPPGR
jgi:hypothetical protein